MNPELDKRALALYERALDLAPAEREAFLRQAAADSDELLELLLRMLRTQTPDERLERSSRAFSLLSLLQLAGRTLGDYRLVKEIGGGAVGRVFVAEQLSLRRRVAVKVLRLEFSENQEMLRRFRDEPELQGKLQHPGIVKVLSTGCEEGWHFFAMEYVEGQSLAKMMEDFRDGKSAAEKPALDLSARRECARVIEEVARALHFAHERGLVHRDVKPHNILIDLRGQPFVSDFGLAKTIDRSALTASLGDGLRGTLAYMSPEQATEFHAVDARADVYSLGVVLYQLLTRCLPFEAETGVELLGKILSRDSHARPPHHFLPGFEHALSAICTRALEKDPARRFASALEMAEHLRAFREGRRVGARAISRLEQIGDRRLDRRTLLKGLGVGAPLAVTAAWLGMRETHAQESGVLRLELPPGVPSAHVLLRRVLPPDSGLAPAEDRGEVASGGSVYGIEEGLYRIVVQTADGALAELQRRLGSESLSARAFPTSVLDPGPGMVRVAGRSTRVDVPMLGLVDYACEPFWIDRAPVTNREYREFLEATGLGPPAEWDRRWIDLANGVGALPRPAHWDDLPAVKVTWAHARAYAEWKGKRLPTIGEWWLALGLEEPSVVRERWEELERLYPFQQPEMIAQGDESPSTLAAYLAYARPVRPATDVAFGPHGILHAFGNVRQWLEPCQYAQSESGQWLPSPARYDVATCWHFDWQSPARYPGIIGLSLEGDSSGDLGFRCAKSALV